MFDILDYYSKWPCKCECPQMLYKRIRKCMVLDRPEWFYKDGRPGRRKPYKLHHSPYRLYAHFKEQEYVDALKTIIRDNEFNPVFLKLRAEEFNSLGQHRQQIGFISEDRGSDLSVIDFGGVAA